MASVVRVFMDVAAGSASLGRVVFELYPGVAPKTVENFKCLCTGTHKSEATGRPLHYKGAPFHRVIEGFMIQGGDFTDGNGTGGESIYGRTFPDEPFTMKHDKPFMLSMANSGPNTNGSQFFITTATCTHLDGKHVVFGKVVDGFDVVKLLDQQPTDDDDKPMSNCFISNCGELVRVSGGAAPKPKKAKKEKKSKKEKKEKKEKKKKKKNKRESEEVPEDDSDDANGTAEPGAVPGGPIGGDGDADGGQAGPAVDTMEEDSAVLAPPPPEPKVSRSGRLVRGRGQLRYRTPSPDGRAHGRRDDRRGSWGDGRGDGRDWGDRREYRGGYGGGRRGDDRGEWRGGSRGGRWRDDDRGPPRRDSRDNSRRGRHRSPARGAEDLDAELEAYAKARAARAKPQDAVRGGDDDDDDDDLGDEP